MSTITKKVGKSGEKTYQVAIRLKGQKPVYKTFSALSRAKAWARKKEAELLIISEQNFSNPTLKEALAYYSDNYSKNAAKPEDEVRRANLFINSDMSSLRANEFKPNDVIQWIKTRTQKVKGDTAIRELTTLSNAIKVANVELNAGIYPEAVKEAKSYCRKNKLLVPSERREVRVSNSELETILNKSGSDALSDIAWFALYTGMRRGEIFNLEWSMLSTTDGKLTASLPASITKTSTARDVPILPVASEIIHSQVRQLHNNKVFSSFSDEGNISQAFTRAAQRAERPDINFHDLRHEATSRFFEMGLSTEQVMSITGHKDYRSIARYTHLSKESVTDALYKAAEGVK